MEGYVSDTDEILIGEGVALESGAAPVSLRMLSGLIDFIATWALLIGLSILVGNALSHAPGAWQAAASILAVFTALVIFP